MSALFHCLQMADGGLKLTGALGETTSKAAGVLAAGVTTAVGTTRQGVGLGLHPQLLQQEHPCMRTS